MKANDVHTLTIRCDTREKANLFKDILDKTINENLTKINKEDAISIIFDFYLKNYNKSMRTRELIRRSEYMKRDIWKQKQLEKIRKNEYIRHQKMKSKLIIKLESLIELIKEK